MQVIGAGFGRTGTLSMKAALERLGYRPCYHMAELLDHPEHGPLWTSALRGDAIDWEELFAHYESATDWPACTFWRELADRCPEAKVVLTVRDPGRWWDSIDSTLFAMSRAGRLPAMTAVGEIGRLVMGAAFDGVTTDREHVIRRFEEHNERVRGPFTTVRSHGFGITLNRWRFNLSQTWKSCTHLGCQWHSYAPLALRPS